jgi:hypothetical protein
MRTAGMKCSRVRTLETPPEEELYFRRHREQVHQDSRALIAKAQITVRDANECREKTWEGKMGEPEGGGIASVHGWWEGIEAVDRGCELSIRRWEEEDVEQEMRELSTQSL